AVILSLVIQGLFAYMFEYFAAGYMVSEKLAGTDANQAAVTGMAAAAASSAPIGDMAILVGNSVLGGIGFGLMISIAVTVGLAILGTTLSCLNTAVRVSYAMAQDKEMPELLGAMHGRFATPHRAIWVLVVVSTLIAWVGVYSVVGLTGITLASNFGTFVLYGLTCVWTIIAFAERKEYSVLKHLIVPGLGLIANLAMLGAILYLYIIGNADAQHEAYVCFAIAGADGLGGHAAGEVASALALEVLAREMDRAPGSWALTKRLRRAVQEANLELYNKAIVVPELRGMGTTLTASAVVGGTLVAAHVGDCRLFLWREGTLTQLTKDHTWVWEQMQYGLLSPEDARTHPRRNMLTRCLGRELIVGIDVLSMDLRPRDIIVQCSDGIHVAV